MLDSRLPAVHQIVIRQRPIRLIQPINEMPPHLPRRRHLCRTNLRPMHLGPLCRHRLEAPGRGGIVHAFCELKKPGSSPNRGLQEDRRAGERLDSGPARAGRALSRGMPAEGEEADRWFLSHHLSRPGDDPSLGWAAEGVIVQDQQHEVFVAIPEEAANGTEPWENVRGRGHMEARPLPINTRFNSSVQDMHRRMIWPISPKQRYADACQGGTALPRGQQKNQRQFRLRND